MGAQHDWWYDHRPIPPAEEQAILDRTAYGERITTTDEGIVRSGTLRTVPLATGGERREYCVTHTCGYCGEAFTRERSRSEPPRFCCASCRNAAARIGRAATRARRARLA